MHWINKDGTAFPTNAVIRIDSLPYTIKHVGNNTSAHYVAMSQMMYNIQFGQQHKHYFFAHEQKGTRSQKMKHTDISSLCVPFGHS